MPVRLRLAAVAVALVFPLVLGHTRADAATRSLCASSSAAGVVRVYYQALNLHRPAAAEACLTAHYLSRLAPVVDPDWKNVTAARVVSIKARAIGASILPPDVRPLPHEAVQIGAAVMMHYRQVEGSPNGLNIWFIYVIKQRATSPWRIADIGSGP